MFSNCFKVVNCTHLYKVQHWNGCIHSIFMQTNFPHFFDRVGLFSILVRLSLLIQVLIKPLHSNINNTKKCDINITDSKWWTIRMNDDKFIYFQLKFGFSMKKNRKLSCFSDITKYCWFVNGFIYSVPMIAKLV